MWTNACGVRTHGQAFPLRVRGATLIEVIAFVALLGVTMTALAAALGSAVQRSTDPLVRVRALELAQAELDRILTRRFDENTPTGGVPACGSAAGNPCAGITVPDAGYDDVGDFHGYSDTTTYDPYSIGVTVQAAGADLGIPNPQARLITVTVSGPATHGVASGVQITLSAYKVNF
jgi:MSHA pilin protein MshD